METIYIYYRNLIMETIYTLWRLNLETQYYGDLVETLYYLYMYIYVHTVILL